MISDAEKNKVEKGTLYLTGTPIGNLADLSPRAVKVLSEVDFIAAEDTRNSQKLLRYFELNTPLISYHKFNETDRGEEICVRLANGESAALITDAGMPAVSDPGEILVRMCREKGIPVKVVPGPTAFVSALALSGFPSARFTFEGFLPAQSGERSARLSALASEERTMIFYEAPHKLVKTLHAMAESFGTERRIAVCRELTKINEEVLRFALNEAIAYFDTVEPKGEFVLVLCGAEPKEADRPENVTEEVIRERVSQKMNAGADKKTAVKEAAKELGLPKNQVYQLFV